MLVEEVDRVRHDHFISLALASEPAAGGVARIATRGRWRPRWGSGGVGRVPSPVWWRALPRRGWLSAVGRGCTRLSCRSRGGPSSSFGAWLRRRAGRLRRRTARRRSPARLLLRRSGRRWRGRLGARLWRRAGRLRRPRARALRHRRSRKIAAGMLTRRPAGAAAPRPLRARCVAAGSVLITAGSALLAVRAVGPRRCATLSSPRAASARAPAGAVLAVVVLGSARGRTQRSSTAAFWPRQALNMRL